VHNFSIKQFRLGGDRPAGGDPKRGPRGGRRAPGSKFTVRNAGIGMLMPLPGHVPAIYKHGLLSEFLRTRRAPGLPNIRTDIPDNPDTFRWNSSTFQFWRSLYSISGRFNSMPIQMSLRSNGVAIVSRACSIDPCIYPSLSLAIFRSLSSAFLRHMQIGARCAKVAPNEKQQSIEIEIHGRN